MSCYQTMLEAVRKAVAFVHPELHTELVQWAEEPALMGDMHITLSVVSDRDEDPVPIKKLTLQGDGTYAVQLLQRSLIAVDVKVEGFDATSFANGEAPVSDVNSFARKLRAALYLDEVSEVMHGDDVLHPVVLVGEIGPVQNGSADRGGRTLPIRTFEVLFRALSGNIEDPTSIGRITKAHADGTVTQGADTITSTWEGPTT
jgi:hypothetical protein